MTQLNVSIPLDEAADFRGRNIPTNIIPLISKTAWSEDCFIRQQFSANLQTYLIDYVVNISSFYDVPI